MTRRLSGRTLAWLGLIFVAIVIAIVARERRVDRQASLLRSDFSAILADERLRRIAIADGRPVYLARCASCHGVDGKGDPARAMPDLTDDDFLYGNGSVGEIEQIVLHGIRSGDSRGWDLASMPGFAKAVPYTREKLPPLTPTQIGDLVAFLRGANGHPGDAAAQARGSALATGPAGCWDCHGRDMLGDPAIGAPNLLDGKWLKGHGSVADLTDILQNGFHGVSPAYAHILDAYKVRAVSAYVASLHPPVRPEPS